MPRGRFRTCRASGSRWLPRIWGRPRGEFCSRVRLSRKGRGAAVDSRRAGRGRGSADSLLGGGEVSVELEEVVGSGDQAPFGPGGRSVAPGEAREPAVVFGVAEDRLDQLLSLAVQLVAEIGGQDRAHEVVGAAVP